MTLGDLASKLTNINELYIKFWDNNMGMMRNIEQDEVPRFVDNHSNLEVRYVTAGSFQIIVEIYNPFN